MVAYIDPFGAPEFFVDDIAFRQLVGTEYIRFGYFSVEGDDHILRVKIVAPVRAILNSHISTRDLVAHARAPRLLM
jgi:hypothetical protein